LRIDARGTNVLEIEDNTLIQSGARLWLFSGRLRLGRNTILRDGVTLKTSGDLNIGEYVRINSHTVIHCHKLIEVADRVGIADHGLLVDSDHPHDGTDTWFMSKTAIPAPIHVGRNTMIAAGCVITRGVHLAPNSLVAAGAVVRAGEYPAGWIIGGVPAKPLRALGEAHQS
jgi:acetyltransferase-like isoleucine patch superfamily enzyme